MKRITRIIISFCLMLMLTEGVNGQSVRFGVESNVGFGPYYKYDSSGFLEGKERSNMLLWSANIYYDIIFPRKWTPNWMALSMQLGAGFMDWRYNDSCIKDYFAEFEDYMSRGVNMPIGIDVKFLISDNIRFFVNCGPIFYFNIYDQLDDVLMKDYLLGYNYGLGLEFGALRIGYKLTNFPNTIYEENIGNKYENIHTLSMGIMFNGNRFLKKKSYLKVY